MVADKKPLALILFSIDQKKIAHCWDSKMHAVKKTAQSEMHKAQIIVRNISLFSKPHKSKTDKIAWILKKNNFSKTTFYNFLHI